MPRPPRIIDPSGVYHVYNRGNNKAPIFKESLDYEKFLELLSKNASEFEASIFHFCLMPNHFHLLMRPNAPLLPKFMHALMNAYSKHFCVKYRFVGHVWQGRYKCKHVPNDLYLFSCGNYIEMNPVRAGLVERPEDWPYSSYNYYGFGTPLPIVEEDPFFHSLGRTDDERRFQYRRHVGATRHAGAWHRFSEQVPGTGGTGGGG